MKPNERVRAVYAGERPDQVPLLLDLSHWYKKHHNLPFDLTGLREVETGLVELHQQLGAVAYVEMGSCYSLSTDDSEVTLESSTEGGVFSTRISTPLGTLRDERVFNPDSYSYGISRHLLQSPEDFPIVEYVMDRLQCRPDWTLYRAWKEALGDLFYGYVQLPYSGSGYLMSRYMGVEQTVFAVHDVPDQVHRLVQAVNGCNLRILDAIIDGPFDTLFVSDNYDSNVQTEAFFDAYVRDHYTEVARRVHAKGKYLAVHVDGESRGILGWLAECGVDCADAVTPHPMFDLTPAQQRAEAGPDLILSGGIPVTLFSETSGDAAFVDCVRRWLDTRLTSPRLLMAAGDQVPTDAALGRIAMLPELVDRYGRY